MKHFLRNIIIVAIAISPVFIYYIAADPYSVVWRKEPRKCPNSAYQGYMLFKIYNNSLNYDSFILGSSRSRNYYIDDWKDYIGESASALHFDQSGDNLRGATVRLKYLYENTDHIDNILLIMDHDFLNSMIDKTGYQFRNPWQVTGKKDFYAFHRDFFKAFYELENQLKYWGHQQQVGCHDRYFISEYNEEHLVGADKMLDDGRFDEYNEKFVLTREKYYWFYERDTIEIIEPPIIQEEQLEALNTIKDLFVKGNTKYRIVISPLYDQRKLNSVDLEILENIFGKEFVFDFSGINEYTNDISNYYEASHYRPRLCRKIMKKIYE